MPPALSAPWNGTASGFMHAANSFDFTHGYDSFGAMPAANSFDATQSYAALNAMPTANNFDTTQNSTAFHAMPTANSFDTTHSSAALHTMPTTNDVNATSMSLATHTMSDDPAFRAHRTPSDATERAALASLAISRERESYTPPYPPPASILGGPSVMAYVSPGQRDATGPNDLVMEEVGYNEKVFTPGVQDQIPAMSERHSASPHKSVTPVPYATLAPGYTAPGSPKGGRPRKELRQHLKDVSRKLESAFGLPKPMQTLPTAAKDTNKGGQNDLTRQTKVDRYMITMKDEELKKLIRDRGLPRGGLKLDRAERLADDDFAVEIKAARAHARHSLPIADVGMAAGADSDVDMDDADDAADQVTNDGKRKKAPTMRRSMTAADAERAPKRRGMQKELEGLKGAFGTKAMKAAKGGRRGDSRAGSKAGSKASTPARSLRSGK
ncbi:hypothetical protein NA57DRAFT_59615 [Rhizodiscina lignyota]|uniref:SAP domain-containing protein n=1 Tax=Rhizodiscina lignyota TaxID=1504668 RepID=A0A9P4IBQ4_9PEZI|nr:hypothetical protein NA57DRAFT_59615 [Rhizodiscina lignyota]